MRIAQGIILDLLKPSGPELLIPESAFFFFRQIYLLDDIPISSGESVFYVGTWRQVQTLDPSFRGMTCTVRMGSRDEILPLAERHDSNLIIIPDLYSLASMTNRLYTGFDEARKWSSDLEMVILAKKDYQTIISIGTRFSGKNPIIVVNSSYNLIVGSMPSLSSHERINVILRNGYYSKDTTDGLARMGRQINGTKYTTSTVLYPPNHMNCPLMVLSIHADNGTFSSLITIYSVEDEPTEAQLQLFSYSARKVRKYYLEDSGKNASTFTPLEVFMANLIDYTREDETFLRDHAHSLRLPLDASYRLCVIQWDKLVLPQADYIMNRLRSCLKFPFLWVLLYYQSALLPLKGDISSLRLIEGVNEPSDEFGEPLEIRQGHAGFLTANFPLLKTNVAYRQAATAVRYGTILNPETGIYFYSHYYIYEMLDDYKKRYALEDMSMQKLALLSDLAEDRYDNLAPLRNYLLAERSISSTTKIIHMHRSSATYRLNKIQGILGLDLNDPDVHLRLLTSLKILELQPGHIQPAPAIEAPSNGAISFYE